MYGDECPTGHYCPSHSGEPIACSAGTYQPELRATNITSCLLCTPGQYCALAGLANVTGPCTMGYFCSGSFL